ncbi:MAG: outer membrane protein assembly factor BamB [Gammaproteobacteria bacterium]|nr:outer membrane protein assembly factor BamB [Gammaproteobacteria bacterium]
MSYKFKNILIAIYSIVILSSCSTFEGLRFWKSDEVDPDEPKKLLSFNAQNNLNIDWDISFNGVNEIGSFEPGFSSENLFFADSEGTLVSINTSNGEKNWEKQLNFLSSGVASGFGIIVVSDIDGNVIALSQDDGSEIWSKNVKGEVLSKAAIDPKTVIVKTGSGELIGLNKSSGEIVWSYRSKLPSLTIRGSSSPVLFDGQVYVTFDNGRLGVFDVNTGYLIWDSAISYADSNSELDNLVDSDSNPIVEGGLVYATNYQGKLNIFDIAQKRSVWSYDASSFFSPVITRGVIIIIESNSNIKSFSSKSLEESWTNEDYLNRDLSNAVSFKGNLVFGDFEGYVHVLNPLNGITTGRKKVSKKSIKTIFSRSNSLYAIDEEFNLFSIKI